MCVNRIEFFFLGKYYVIDSKYPIMKGYLTPYKGISYHLQEFRRRGGNPRIRHENFNHAHSFFRCVIERTFGVWKNKWRMVCCRRQPKIKPILLKIYVVVRVRIVPTESI